VYVVPAVAEAAPLTETVGGALRTVTRIVSKSSRGGEPLSVTRTVTSAVAGPSVGVQENWPAKETPREDVALLYRIRWFAELDLRALKQTLQMDVLRGQTPEMVRKEIWAHLLAYNVIRGLMAQAARQAGLVPLELSFKGAVQAVNAFATLLWTASAEELAGVCQRLREVVASYRLENRPNRSEPRARKRRPKNYPLLREPRRKLGNRLGEKTCI
jgi:hypothetical protein